MPDERITAEKRKLLAYNVGSEEVVVSNQAIKLSGERRYGSGGSTDKEIERGGDSIRGGFTSFMTCAAAVAARG